MEGEILTCTRCGAAMKLITSSRGFSTYSCGSGCDYYAYTYQETDYLDAEILCLV